MHWENKKPFPPALKCFLFFVIVFKSDSAWLHKKADINTKEQAEKVLYTLITFNTSITLSSIRCNKYLDSSWSQQEQWIYILSWKLIYAPTLSKNVEVSRIFVGVLSEWILLLFPEADCHSIWHSTLYTTLYTTAKKKKNKPQHNKAKAISATILSLLLLLFCLPAQPCSVNWLIEHCSIPVELF